MADNSKTISSEEAKRDYQISSAHSRMENGELRFRLQDDRTGTAYILTEATETSGWQKSHFHQKVLETYIVQSGWIVLAELIGSDVSMKKYEAGEMFTTRPFVVHNIFMSSNSKIHTVKHGEQATELGVNDWFGDTEEAQTLNAATVNLGSDAVLRKFTSESVQRIGSLPSPTPPEPLHSESYRHFDTLIWQVGPVSAAYVIGFLSLYDSKFINSPIASWTLFFSVLFMSLLSFTLLRFRYHQNLQKRYFVSNARLWLNPQSGMQFLINLSALSFAIMWLERIEILTISKLSNVDFLLAGIFLFGGTTLQQAFINSGYQVEEVRQNDVSRFGKSGSS